MDVKSGLLGKIKTFRWLNEPANGDDSGTIILAFWPWYHVWYCCNCFTNLYRVQALSWGPNVASLDAANRGLGQHYQKIARPPHLLAPLHQFMQNTYAFVILYIIATTVVKFSFIFFVYRIFPLRKLRRFLLACHLFAGLLGLAALLVAIFQCVPVQDFWRTLGGRR